MFNDNIRNDIDNFIDKYLHNIYPLLSGLVLSSIIYLWSLEFGPDRYDVGLNVFLAIISFVFYLPYIVNNFSLFPFVVSIIFILYQVAFSLLNGFDFRSVLLCFVFVFYFYSVFYSLLFCFGDEFKVLRKLILVFLIAQICLQVLEVSGVFQLYEFATVRMYLFGNFGATGLYGEGSHVAFSLVPLMFIKDERGRHLNASSVLAGISVLLAISSTAIVGVLLLFILLILKINSWRRVGLAFLVIFGFLIVLFVGWQVFHFRPFAALAVRIWGILQIISGEIDRGVNLSALVYANGMNMAWAGVKDILGSGLGNFSIYFDQSIGREAIDQISHGPLNKDDGSCVLFKMIGEMGILGLIIVGYFMFKNIAIIIRHGDSFISVLACFIIMSALRSAGYFHGPYIISFALVGVLWEMRRMSLGGVLKAN